MKLIPVIAIALLSSLGAVAASTPGEFTRAFAKTLEQASAGAKVTVTKDLEIEITLPGKPAQEMFLYNAYQAYAQSPGKGHEIITRYADGALESLADTSPPLKRDCIVPIVKDRAWIDEIRSMAQKKKQDKGTDEILQVWESYNDDLVVLYAEDTPKNIRYFSTADLTKAGLTLAELRPLALQNLKKLAPNLQLVRSGEVLIMTAGSGVYDSSLLLATGIWTSGQIKVPGEIIVAIPARDTLFITGSTSKEGVAWVQHKAAELAKTSPYRLTPQLFVFRDGKFVRFQE